MHMYVGMYNMDNYHGTSGQQDYVPGPKSIIGSWDQGLFRGISMDA
jgi:hypothetical protein